MTTEDGLRYWGNSGTGVEVDVTLADGQQRHVHVDRADATREDAVLVLPTAFGDENPIAVSLGTLAGLSASSDWSTAKSADEHEAMILAAEREAAAAAFTAAEEVAVAEDVADGTILDDEQLAAWVAGASVADLLEAVGDDVVLAKRVLLAEQARADDARKGLTGSLLKLTTETE